jgi:hypothetical protein
MKSSIPTIIHGSAELASNSFSPFEAESKRKALPDLSDVTLVAVTSVNVAATVAAIERSMAQASFGAVKLLTDSLPVNLPSSIEWVPITPISTSESYSNFILERLVDHLTTSHCLVTQWDGHVLDGSRWRPEFLEYDYIGATWPQFDDCHVVGNGGFSLRSKVLLEACRSSGFRPSHPEDLAICRYNRVWLEAQGIRFAPTALADTFSAERQGDPAQSFGYHGIWHMPKVFGCETFWEIYASLDDRTSARHDFFNLVKQVVRGRGGLRRAIALICDQLRRPT